MPKECEKQSNESNTGAHSLGLMEEAKGQSKLTSTNNSAKDREISKMPPPEQITGDADEGLKTQ
ncbi:hypothetical protein Ancab_028922, partial [Ancistrocladus abbreviatus]